MKTLWRFIEPFVLALVYYFLWYKWILIHQWNVDPLDAALFTVLIMVALFGFTISHKVEELLKDK